MRTSSLRVARTITSYPSCRHAGVAERNEGTRLPRRHVPSAYLPVFHLHALTTGLPLNVDLDTDPDQVMGVWRSA
ncbi:MAG: hypothetical protein WCG47_32845 [Dermatophilaceae bacterium]